MIPSDIDEKKYIMEGMGLYCEKYPCVKCIKINNGTEIKDPCNIFLIMLLINSTSFLYV